MKIQSSLLFCLFLQLGVTHWSHAQSEGANFDETRVKIQKWVETEQLISQKKADWEEAKSLLEARIELIQSEVTDYEERIKEAEASIAESDEQKAKLVAENEALKSATDTLKTLIIGMEKRVKADILTGLPEILSEKIKPLSQKLPDNPDESELSLSQRFQNVVGTLNEINKFNSTITPATQIREIGGKEAEVKTIFLGLGQAYYVNNEGTLAGVGRPGSNGWDWEPVNQRAPEIMRIFQIMDGELQASFIPLPFQVQ
ncbi:MAG: DUF3450 family protein [Verrucomicrobiota bacterium]